MFTELQGYLVVLRFGGGPGAAGNIVRHNYVFCKDWTTLDTKGGRIVKVTEFSEDTVDSFHLGDYSTSTNQGDE